MITLNELKSKLKRETEVALFCHIRPDGDCIGSAVALKLAFDSIGIKADVFCEDAVPTKCLFLDSVKCVKNTKEDFSKYSALIAIDSADITRIGCYAHDFEKHKNTYNIDHHVSNTRYAKENVVIDNGANCENIYELLLLLDAKIDNEIANLLAMGIMTDTGNFHHKNVTENTLVIASKLLALGADFNQIYFNMFAKQSKERAKLFGIVMSKLRYMLDGRLGVATVFKSDIAFSGAKQEDTEGFIDFLMGVEGVEVGVCLMEMAPNVFKASFRSKGPNVNAVASVFGGGGHVLASGCQVNGEYEEVVDRIRYEVSKELID